jgi:hypothetical protein
VEPSAEALHNIAQGILQRCLIFDVPASDRIGREPPFHAQIESLPGLTLNQRTSRNIRLNTFAAAWAALIASAGNGASASAAIVKWI